MKVYADLPARRLRQVLGDVAVLLWCLVWGWVGKVVHDGTLGLAAPGRQLISTGEGFGATMTKAGDSVDDLPLLGDKVATPFRSAARSGAGLRGRTPRDHPGLDDRAGADRHRRLGVGVPAGSLRASCGGCAAIHRCRRRP
jgi:hypothetical protein